MKGMPAMDSPNCTLTGAACQTDAGSEGEQRRQQATDVPYMRSVLQRYRCRPAHLEHALVAERRVPAATLIGMLV